MGNSVRAINARVGRKLNLRNVISGHRFCSLSDLHVVIFPTFLFHPLRFISTVLGSPRQVVVESAPGPFRLFDESASHRAGGPQLVVFQLWDSGGRWPQARNEKSSKIATPARFGQMWNIRSCYERQRRNGSPCGVRRG